MIEEVFDNIERSALSRPPHASARRQPRALLANRLFWARPHAVPVPSPVRLLHEAVPRPDFADAWRLPLPPGMSRDPRDWRNVLPFPVRGTADREPMVGKDASHLDFRSSIVIEDDAVALAAAVRLHNTRGRLYVAVAGLAHPYMTRLVLRRAHRRLALSTRAAGERNAGAPRP